MKKVKFLYVVLALLMVLSMALAACSAGSSEAEEPTEATTEESETAETSDEAAAETDEEASTEADVESSTDDTEAAAAPQVGGEVVVGLTADPMTLEPWTTNDLNASLIMNLVVPGLMVVDETGTKVPYILKDYTVSDDALVYTVTIHEGLTWHDGVPFTAEDLAFTASYIVEHQLSFGADMYSVVASTEVVDDTTIIYTLTVPSVNFMTQVGYWVPVMPKHVYETVDDPINFQYEGLGYGPYQVSDYKKGEYYQLTRVPDWPLANDGAGAFIETITFRIFPDANALVLAMINGEVDATGATIPVAGQKQLESNPEQFGVAKVQSLGYNYMEFNYANPLLADFAVREAIAMTIDREAIVNIAMEGGAIPMYTPISPAYADMVASNVTFPVFDVDAAAASLEEAGYVDSDGDGVRESADGSPLEFALTYYTSYANGDSVASIIQTNAAKAGISIVPEPIDRTVYFGVVTLGGDWDIAMRGWGVIDDTDSALATVYRSDSALSVSGHTNAAMDEILDAVQVEPDYATRVSMMDEFQRVFVTELPSVSMWVNVNAYGYSKSFEGWHIAPGLYGVMAVTDFVNVYAPAE
ncbi:MAG: ABC transporter substrate-binding protein [Anaerolineaceae bacterium]|nr:ABC transporter substrate-binding protein [Anaerolineaceae bacterium]